MPSVDSTYGNPQPRPATNRQVSGYNPQAYVPGGSTRRVATAIQTRGGQRPAAYRPPRATPAPQRRPPAPAPQPAQPQADPYSYDYDQDPVLQRIQSLGMRDREGARAEALSSKKQVAIDYGDADLARQLGDENTATAAAGNPLGVRQQLRHSYDENVQDFEQGLPSNLFYSGHRGQELGNLATGYQEGLAGAGRQQQELLTGIERSLADALSGIDQRDMEGQESAVARALAAGLGGGFDTGESEYGGDDLGSLLTPDAANVTGLGGGTGETELAYLNRQKRLERELSLYGQL